MIFTDNAAILLDNTLSTEEKVLDTFGFPTTIIDDAVKSSYMSSLTVSPLHPKNTRGTRFYQDLVKNLRDLLMPYGAIPQFDQGLELAIMPAKNIAIAVMSGDSYTGIIGTGIPPRSKRPKGESTKKFVKRNDGQGRLFADTPEVKADPKPKTWIFLHYLDDNAVRFELSLPSDLDNHDYIDKWVYRVCFPEIVITHEAEVAPQFDDFPDINIPVKRKTEE